MLARLLRVLAPRGRRAAAAAAPAVRRMAVADGAPAATAPATAAAAPAPAAALAALREELAALSPGGARAAELPAYVECLSAEPRALAHFLFEEAADEGGEEDAGDGEEGGGERRAVVVAPNADGATQGPWEVDATVRGAAGGPYDRGVRFTLTVPADFPTRPPRVAARGVMRHLLLADDGEPMPVFYREENYPPNERGEYDVLGCLRAAHELLSRPLRWPEGIMPEEQYAEVCAQWAAVARQDAERHALIARYAPLRKHACLFGADASGLPREWFDEGFANAVLDEGLAPEERRARLARLLTKECEGAYSFAFLKESFCDKLVEEAEHYQASGLPVRRPNSMNAYGLILNEIGLEGTLDALQRRALQPLAAMLFPTEGCRFDAHHSFLVHYELGADLGLDMHTDDSDVTFNTCLGKNFEGAGLSLCGVMGEDTDEGGGNRLRKLRHVYRHKKGRCLVHLGRHRHGADDITSGERINLIVWNHNHLWRKSTPYRELSIPGETEEPDPQCLSYTHDRDFSKYKTLKPEQKEFAKRAWYPPLPRRGRAARE